MAQLTVQNISENGTTLTHVNAVADYKNGNEVKVENKFENSVLAGATVTLHIETELTADADGGVSTSIDVTDASRFDDVTPDTVIIGADGDVDQESIAISSISSNTISFGTTAVTNDHAVGEPVRVEVTLSVGADVAVDDTSVVLDDATRVERADKLVVDGVEKTVLKSDTFVNNGETMISLENAEATEKNIEVLAIKECNQGHLHNREITIPASGSVVVSPLDKVWFGTNATIDYKGESLSVAVFKD